MLTKRISIGWVLVLAACNGNRATNDEQVAELQGNGDAGQLAETARDADVSLGEPYGLPATPNDCTEEMCRTGAVTNLSGLVRSDIVPRELLTGSCLQTPRGTACDCSPENEKLDGARLGPEGDGCYVTSKTGECLFGDGDGFSGCDIGDDSSCDAACEDLTNRLKADAELEVDSELLYSECIDNQCWAVGRIEDKCYTNDFFGVMSIAHSHDCSLGGEAILDEHLAE